MSGWEPSDWYSGGGEPQSTVEDAPDGDGFLRNNESSIFSVDTLERNASKGHGLVTSVAAGNNVLLNWTSALEVLSNGSRRFSSIQVADIQYSQFVATQLQILTTSMGSGENQECSAD